MDGDPAGNEVATEEVDAEILAGATLAYADGTRETPAISAGIREFTKRKNEGGDKKGNWARLAEMESFSFRWPQFLQNKVSHGYLQHGRQSNDPLTVRYRKRRPAGRWFTGPVGDRVAHAAAALTCGTLNADKPGE